MSKLYKQGADLGAPEVSETLPSDFPFPPSTTGTVDDDDGGGNPKSLQAFRYRLPFAG
jgi:hypothetical protein